MSDKPTEFIDWIASGAGRTEPSGGKKTTGFEADERPACEYFNWLFGIGGDWIRYLSEFPEQGAMGRGLLRGLDVTYVSATRIDIAAGSLITRVGRKEQIDAALTDHFSASPPTAYGGAGGRLDIIVYEDDPVTETGEFIYVEDVAGSLDTYVDLASDYTPIALIIVANGVSYTPLAVRAFSYKFGSIDPRARTIYVADGLHATDGDFIGVAWLQGALNLMNTLGGGTVKLLGSGWNIGNWNGSFPIIVPSKVTLDINGNTINPGANAQNVLAFFGAKMTAALSTSGGEWNWGNVGSWPASPVNNGFYSIGVGGIVEFTSGANSGIRCAIKSITSAIACKLMALDGEAITGLAADAAATAIVRPYQARIENGVVDCSDQTVVADVVMFRYAESCSLAHVRLTRDGSADGEAIHFRNSCKRITLDDVRVDGDFSAALYGTNDTDRAVDAFSITRCHFGVAHSVADDGTNEAGIYADNIDVDDVLDGTLPDEWLGQKKDEISGRHYADDSAQALTNDTLTTLAFDGLGCSVNGYSTKAVSAGAWALLPQRAMTALVSVNVGFACLTLFDDATHYVAAYAQRRLIADDSLVEQIDLGRSEVVGSASGTANLFCSGSCVLKILDTEYVVIQGIAKGNGDSVLLEDSNVNVVELSRGEP